MDNDGARANLIKKRDIGGKGGDIVRFTHGMTTKLHDNRLLGISAHEGECLDKHARPLDQLRLQGRRCVAHHFAFHTAGAKCPEPNVRGHTSGVKPSALFRTARQTIGKPAHSASIVRAAIRMR
jgi:hypothetical protein